MMKRSADSSVENICYDVFHYNKKHKKDQNKNDEKNETSLNSLIDYNGKKYYGETRNGKPHGIGKLYTLDGKKLFDGLFSGNFQKGIEYYYDGSKRYKGELRNGKFHGRGIIYHYASKKPLYDGIFTNGQITFGNLYYPNGNIKYIGDFKYESFNGKGILYYEDGTIKHKGRFENDMFIGP